MQGRYPIKTKHFTLRTLGPTDVSENYLSWFNDPLVQQFILYKPESIESLKSYVSEKYESRHALMFGIFDKKEFHIGNIKFEPIDFSNHSAVMGILIGESSWRSRGIAREVIVAGANYLKKEYGTKKIDLGVDPENHRAIRSYEKIGFQFSDSKNNTTMSWVVE